MIIIQASSIDELNAIWRRLRTDFQVIERIHVDPRTLQYKMVITQPNLTKMMKSVSDKVIDRISLYEDNPLKGIVSFHMFNERVEEDEANFPSLEPIAKIWSFISDTDKRAVYAYMVAESNQEAVIDENQLLNL